MQAREFIIALVHVDMEHGYAGDLIEGVGARGSVVTRCAGARRFKSLKRALDAAQGWTWYADIVRVMAVEG